MQYTSQNYPLVSLAEIRETGQTPSQLRATANSLERIASKGYHSGGTFHPAYNAYKARATARHLRRLAKMLEMERNTGGRSVSEPSVGMAPEIV